MSLVLRIHLLWRGGFVNQEEEAKRRINILIAFETRRTKVRV